MGWVINGETQINRRLGNSSWADCELDPEPRLSVQLCELMSDLMPQGQYLESTSICELSTWAGGDPRLLS